MNLDLIHTLAFAGLVLFLGYGIRRAVPPLARYNIPAPVVGGLLVALVVTVCRRYGLTPVTFDTTLQAPLMIAFFTSIGFGASVALLRVGGPAVLVFFGFSTAMAIAQNVVGGAAAWALGENPLLGVMAGSVTLTGGPATGLAFAPLFEAAGLMGAPSVVVAAAMAGIVSGGLMGGPVGTWVIARNHVRVPRSTPGVAGPATEGEAAGASSQPVLVAQNVVENRLPEPPSGAPSGEDVESYGLLKSLVVILFAMWAGSWLSAGFAALHFTLPSYIGAMLVAAVLRNLDDAVGWIGLSQRTIDDIGNVALALFLVLALMTLKLWELAALAVPLTVILVAQVAAVALVSLGPVYRLMGRDYDSAVMSAGFCGFMLGTTANAMANMRALVERYGPAPRAFLVVPMVGAFFIDFTNAVIITVFLNLWR